MKIQVLTRFEKKPTEEELEQRSLNEKLGLSLKTIKPTYEYDILVQDVDNIVGFNYYNDTHISLRTKLGEVFIVKFNIKDFIKVWEKNIGEEIINFG